jgi:bacteriorhodopsin
MVLNVSAWGSAQWAFYAIGIGFLSGILGNMCATAFMHYKEEKSKLKNKPINWKNEMIASIIIIGLIIVIIFGTLFLS